MRILWYKECGIATIDRLFPCMQCGNIIKNPKRAPHGRDGKIISIDLNVSYWCNRQILLKGFPCFPVIEGHKQTEFCAGIEEPFTGWIFSHHSGWVISRDAVFSVCKKGPAFSVVFCFKYIWFPVSQLIAEDRDISF